MSKPIKIKLPDTHEEWMDQRRSGLGGSDAGAVLGLNPYKSAYTLWAEKSCLMPDEVEDNEAMRQGRDLEEYVAQRFCEATGKKVQRSGFSYQSAEYPWMLANIDRKVIGENAGLECKTSNPFKDKAYEGGDIPPHYYAQCLHYMAVMGFDRMYIAIVVYGKGFYWFQIDREDCENDIKALIDAEREFWQCVQNDIEPDIDGSDSTTATLNALNRGSGTVCDMSEYDVVFDRLDEVKGEIKLLEEKKKKFENMIRQGLNLSEAGYGKGTKYQASWKPQTSRRIDTKALRANMPSVADQFTVESTTTPLRITRRKAEKERANG